MKSSQKKRIRISGRIIALVFAAFFGALFILWDTGIIDLPFLVRRDRKAPVAENSDSETKETKVFDYTAYAKDCLNRLPDTAHLTEEGFTPLLSDFRANSATLAVTRLQDGDWQIYSSFLYDAQSGVMLTLSPTLKVIENPTKLIPTERQTAGGETILQSPDDASLWYYDAQSGAFIPAADGFYFGKEAFPLPPTVLQSDAMPILYRENDRYGYLVTRQVGKRTETVTLPAVYPKAFSASEGFAVAQDDSGRVHVIDATGEDAFTLPLVLPDDDNSTKSMGYYYVDHGLLRVRLNEQAEDKTILLRDTVIDTSGREVDLPRGYRVASLREGILVLTDGNHFGYYTPDRGWLCDPVYTGCAPFFGGLAVVQNADGKKGLVDASGTEILPPAFDYISRFSGGNLILYAEGIGWRLLTEIVKPDTPASPLPPETSYYTKITITRGPKNTFDHEDDVIIELPPILSTVPYTTRPDNTEPTVAPK